MYIFIIFWCICLFLRRKIRIQTSDNMDRWKNRGWKSRGGKSQGRERKKEKPRRKVRNKKMQAREKVEKSRDTVFFPMFCGPFGPKTRLRRCGAKHVSKSKCQEQHMSGPLMSREVHSQVKSVKNLTVSDHFLKLGCGLAWQGQWILLFATSEPNVFQTCLRKLEMILRTKIIDNVPVCCCRFSFSASAATSLSMFLPDGSHIKRVGDTWIEGWIEGTLR